MPDPAEPKLSIGGAFLLALAISLVLWVLIVLALRDHAPRPGTLDIILNHQGADQ